MRRVIGGDGGDRPVAQRVDQHRAVCPRCASGGFIFLFGSSDADRVVGQAQMVRRHLTGRADTGAARAAQVVDRLARREVHEVHLLAGVGGEVDVAGDHQALAERRPAADPELGRDRARVRVPAARERLLLAVDGDRPPGERVVLQRAAHHAGSGDRTTVVGEPDGAGVGERSQLCELLSA